MAKRQLVDRRRGERRKELRFETKMWVGIAETEGDPEVESCNISAGGMLLRTNRDAGAPGEVRMLRLVTSDLGSSIEIMGLIVRVEHADSASSSASGREITGVAFEFLPLNTEELDEFLSVVVEGEFTVAPVEVRGPLREAESIEPAGESQPSGLTELNVTRMAIETDYPVEAGTKLWLEIEIPAEHSSLRLAGHAVECQSGGGGDAKRYRVEVSFEGGPELAYRPGDSSDQSIAAEGKPARSKSKRAHLSGTISEVGMPSLFSFFELERASGVLILEQDSDKASVFVRDGTIVDVDSEPADTPVLDRLKAVLQWPDCSFEFRYQAVDREDVIGQSATGFLMDAARQSDEDAR